MKIDESNAVEELDPCADAFEAWAVESGLSIEDMPGRLIYKSSTTNSTFLAWIACWDIQEENVNKYRNMLKALLPIIEDVIEEDAARNWHIIAFKNLSVKIKTMLGDV